MSKLYLVSASPAAPSVHLVEAKTKAQALAHVAKRIIVAEIPTAVECVELGKAGVEIEKAE